MFHMIPWLPSLVSLAYRPLSNRQQDQFERTFVDLTCLNLTADKIFEAIFIFQQIWSCLSTCICAKLIHDRVQFKSSLTCVIAKKVNVIVQAWNKNNLRLPGDDAILHPVWLSENRLGTLTTLNKICSLWTSTFAGMNISTRALICL